MSSYSKLLSITISCAMLMIGCNEHHESDLVTIHVDVDRVSNIHETHIIKDVKLVTLQDSVDMVGDIYKIETMDSCLYLLDESGSTVHIYTMNGKHINTISHKGHGSNEYLSLTDFYLDKQAHTVNLLSRLDKRLLIYNSDGNKLLGTKTMPKAFCGITQFENGYVGYMGNYSEDEDQPFNFWLLDRNFNIVSHFGEINKHLESQRLLGLKPFSHLNNTLNVISEFCNDVEVVNNSDRHTAYRLDFGEAGMPVLKDKDYDEENMFLIKNTFITGPKQLQETDTNVLALVVYQGQYLMIVYDKSIGKASACTLEPYTNKYYLGFGEIVSMDEHAIYSIIDASRMYDYWVGHNKYNDFEEKYPEQIKKLRIDVKSVNPDGNPFVVIYELNI